MNKERPRINNQITAPEVRVIDAEGKNLGVMPLEQAFLKAKDANLDLIEVSPAAVPPVVRIMDYGKYRYEQEKKEKAVKKPVSHELKEIRVSLGISEHDLERKAKKADEFLEKGAKVKIELKMRGRAKYLAREFMEEKIKKILAFISVPWRESGEIKKIPSGMYLIIEKMHK